MFYKEKMHQAVLVGRSEVLLIFFVIVPILSTDLLYQLNSVLIWTGISVGGTTCPNSGLSSTSEPAAATAVQCEVCATGTGGNLGFRVEGVFGRESHWGWIHHLCAHNPHPCDPQNEWSSAEALAAPRPSLSPDVTREQALRRSITAPGCQRRCFFSFSPSLLSRLGFKVVGFV